MIVTSASKAAELGLKPDGTHRGFLECRRGSRYRGNRPHTGDQKCLQRAGWSAGDLDLIESNEAFAAQSISVLRSSDWDPAKINVSGGAIALGHPIGASGARILVTLLHSMQHRNANKGLATLCIGGGQGVAMAVERIET